MRGKPARQLLRKGRLDIGVIAGSQHRHKEMGGPNGARFLTDDRHGRARIVHKQLVAGLVSLPQAEI